MKKLVLFLLILVLLPLSFMAVQTARADTVPGDTNGDNVFDGRDIVRMLKKLSGTDNPENDLIEFPYQIWYTRQEDGETIEHLLDDPVCVTYKDSARPVRYQEQLTITGTSLTYDNVFFLKPTYLMSLIF